MSKNKTENERKKIMAVENKKVEKVDVDYTNEVVPAKAPEPNGQ